MPNIKLSDKFALNLDITPNPLSLFGKYLKNATEGKFSELNVSQIANTTIDQVAFNNLNTSINFNSPINLGVSLVELKVKAVAGITLSIIKPGDLLTKDFFGGPPLKATSPSHYLGLRLEAGISGDLSASLLDISFGFNPGTSIEMINYKEFKPSDGIYPTFISALKSTVAEFSIPGDVEDLVNLSQGTIIAVNGNGKLRLSAEANLLTVVNPLLTVNLLPNIGNSALNISSSGSIKVKASFEISSQYQMRLRKLTGNIIELGYYRDTTNNFGASISASLGLSATVANFDLLEQLVKAITNDPKELTQVQTGLNTEQLKQINAAIAEAIQRKLQLSLNYEFSNSDSKQAAFLFEIDLDALSQDTRNALHDALDGNLSNLLINDGKDGITVKRSLLKEISQRKHQLKINLFGIFHFISISKLLKENSVLYDSNTGDLIVSDKVTATRIRASIFSLFTLSKPLLQVLAESMVITTAYQASSIAQSPNLQISHWYYELHSKTNQQTIKDNLDAFVAMGLLPFAQLASELKRLNTKGETSFYLETKYSQNLAQTLFLDDNGKAHPKDLYEKAGRKAIELLVKPGDDEDYRQIPATNDNIWQQMESLGQFNFKAIPQFSSFTNEQLAILASDYSLIVWWRDSMQSLAEALELVVSFLKTPNADLRSHSFKSLHNELLKRMGKVAKDTKMQFNDPWGLIAMSQVLFLVSRKLPDSEAKLIGSNGSLFKP